LRKDVEHVVIITDRNFHSKPMFVFRSSVTGKEINRTGRKIREMSREEVAEWAEANGIDSIGMKEPLYDCYAWVELGEEMTYDAYCSRF
jgi:hypothetical protein